MGVGSAKRASTRAENTPVKTRRSNSRAIKSEGSPTLTPRSSARKKTSGKETAYTSTLPTDQQRRGNGRVTGRSLIVWGRPRMAEKLLLHLQYECTRHKVNLPWDAIAHRLHPGSSGAAVMQHLNRLRRELIAEGHLVPPVPTRPAAGETSDPEIRGYIRQDMNGNDKETTRPVRFDESMDDRKFSLPDAYVDDDESDCDAPVRGSSEGSMESQDSPTPFGRSHRHISVDRHAAKLEIENGSLYPDLPGLSAVGHESMRLDDSFLDSDATMHTSPQARRDHGHDDDDGTSMSHSLFDGGYYPPFAHLRPPNGAERHRPAYAFGDPFEIPKTHHHPEGGVPGLKHPLDFYSHAPYGFAPWQMGYTMPPSFYPLQGHDRKGEKPDDRPVGDASAKEGKPDPLLTETSSSSGTQSSELDDLINENGGDILDTVNPAETINV